MTTTTPLSLRERIAIAKRQPQRLSITVAQSTYEKLIRLSFEQGRSLSNLCASLLESSVRSRL